MHEKNIQVKIILRQYLAYVDIAMCVWDSNN